MKTIVAACVCVQLSLAGSNLVTTSTGVGTVSIQAVPVSPATYIALQVAYDHFHVQDGDSAHFVSMGPTVSNQMFGFRRSGTSIQCHDNLDSGFNGIPSVDVSGWEAEAEDNGFSARCERDPVAKVLILTVCRMDGSHCGRSSAAVDQFGSGTIAAMSIGRSGWGPGVNGLYGDIALIRVSTTPYSLDVPPNAQNAPPGNVADFEFDRSSVDSVSGASWHFQSANPGSDVYTDAEVYTDRRVYSPVCSAGDTKIFQAGVTNSLSAERSFSLDGKGAPSFQWNQTGGPAKLQFASGRNSQKPSLTGWVPGQYDFDLVVTDQSGQSSKCSVTHAAVQTDSHDVIIVQSPFAEIGSLVGPVLRFGASPWSRHTEMQRGWADRQIARLRWTEPLNGLAPIRAYWDVMYSESVTISVNTGDTAMVVAGGDAQAIFCGASGNSKPAENTYVITWWGPREEYRNAGIVAGCPDSAHIIRRTPWHRTQGDQIGKHFVVAHDGDVAPWINGSANNQYYDNVMALYTVYLCTGLTKYLDAARTIADMWYEAPSIDQGYGVDDDGQDFSPFPRIQALTGLYMRALDGRPEMLDGLDRFAERNRITSDASYNLHGVITDMREEAYRLSSIALCALYSVKQRSDCLTWTQHSLSNFLRQQRDAGNWESLQEQLPGSVNDWARGTVTVANGSNSVCLTGATALDRTLTWTRAEVDGQPFWTVSSTFEYKTADALFYTATYVSPTCVMLDRPYAASTESGRLWQAGKGFFGGLGWFTQPFMQGVVMRAIYFAARADVTQREAAQAAIVRGAEWLRVVAYNPARKDIWYGVGGAGACPVSNPCALEVPDRNLQGEILGALAIAYMLKPSPELADMTDNLFGGAWGNFALGEPGTTDTIWLDSQYYGGWDFVRDPGKYFGFWYGFGGSAIWPAARSGGLIPNIQ